MVDLTPLVPGSNVSGGPTETAPIPVGRRLRRHPGAIVGLVLLVALVLLALLGPWLFPPGLTDRPLDVSPSLTHPFGINGAGRDELAEAVVALDATLRIGALAAVVTALLGTVLGSLAGWSRVRRDTVPTRLLALILAVAPTLLAAGWFVGTLSGPSPDGTTLAAALGVFCSGWAVRRTGRRVLRAARGQGHAEAARAFGASARRLVYQHVLPNSADVVLTNFVVGLGQAILLESTVSFLGFGVHAPEVSLGTLLFVNKPDLVPLPWLLWGPFGLIVVAVVSACVIGDGLREPGVSRRRSSL